MLNLRKNQNQPAQLSFWQEKTITDTVCYKCFRVVTEAPLLVKLDGHRLGTFNFSKKFCLIITLDNSESIKKHLRSPEDLANETILFLCQNARLIYL